MCKRAYRSEYRDSSRCEFSSRIHRKSGPSQFWKLHFLFYPVQRRFVPNVSVVFYANRIAERLHYYPSFESCCNCGFLTFRNDDKGWWCSRKICLLSEKVKVCWLLHWFFFTCLVLYVYWSFLACKTQP